MVLCATSTPGPVLSTLPLVPLELLAHPESAITPTIMIPKHAKSFFLVSMCCTSSSKIQITTTEHVKCASTSSPSPSLMERGKGGQERYGVSLQRPAVSKRLYAFAFCDRRGSNVRLGPRAR